MNNIHLLTYSSNEIVKQLLSEPWSTHLSHLHLSHLHPIFSLSMTEFNALSRYSNQLLEMLLENAQHYFKFKEKLQLAAPLDQYPTAYTAMFVDFIFSDITNTSTINLITIRSKLIQTAPALLALLLVRLESASKCDVNSNLSWPSHFQNLPSWMPIVRCIKSSSLLSRHYLNTKNQSALPTQSVDCANAANEFILNYLSDHSYDSLHLKFSTNKYLPNNFIGSAKNITMFDLVMRLMTDIDSLENNDLHLINVKCNLLRFMTAYRDISQLADEIAARYTSYDALIKHAETLMIELSQDDPMDVESEQSENKQQDLKRPFLSEKDENHEAKRARR